MGTHLVRLGTEISTAFIPNFNYFPNPMIDIFDIEERLDTVTINPGGFVYSGKTNLDLIVDHSVFTVRFYDFNGGAPPRRGPYKGPYIPYKGFRLNWECSSSSSGRLSVNQKIGIGVAFGWQCSRLVFNTFVPY